MGQRLPVRGAIRPTTEAPFSLYNSSHLDSKRHERRNLQILAGSHLDVHTHLRLQRSVAKVLNRFEASIHTRATVHMHPQHRKRSTARVSATSSQPLLQSLNVTARHGLPLSERRRWAGSPVRQYRWHCLALHDRQPRWASPVGHAGRHSLISLSSSVADSNPVHRRFR
jgi:hypothetical protein